MPNTFIHREAPPFVEQSTKTEILETGINVIDLIFPILNGGGAAIMFCFVFLLLSVAGPGAVRVLGGRVGLGVAGVAGLAGKVTASAAAGSVRVGNPGVRRPGRRAGLGAAAGHHTSPIGSTSAASRRAMISQ